MIPKETIDEIFQTARVEEVIGEFVHLKKSGSNLKAKSPFVDEKTPSFMVSPAKQIWKCFASSKGGNVVGFLMEHEHFSYVEALKWLANKYNIEIKEDRERTPEEIEQFSIRENLGVVNEFAKNTFVYNLTENEQGKAIGLSYFLDRGFREDTIAKFQLGYCLDESEGFTKLALEKGYKIEFLEKAGLTKVKENRRFDFFRGRVMFPIHSVAGKVLGFGGRTLKKDKKVAKYFNSPESELYNKSKILYGLYFAKNTIIKYDRCYLVEGYTDVISLHQAGVENVVASSGTALTVEQIKLIKRYSDNITILYDGDAAGIRASFRGIDLILEQGMNVKVVLFPDGEDPDSFAKKSTATELETYITENSKDFVVFKSDILLKDADNDPVKKAGMIRDIVASIAVIPDAIKRQVYARECSLIFGMEEQLVVQELAKIRRDKVAKSYKQQSSKPKPSATSFAAPPDEDIPIEAFIPPEYADQVAAEQQKTASTNLYHDLIYPQEYDLVRILLNYGLFNIVTQHVEEDENGNEQIIDIEVPVIELIVHEMEKDEITLENEALSLIFEEFREGYHNDTLYAETHFTRHQNQEIAKVAADIISNRYEVSPNWKSEKIKVRISTEVDKLDRAVMESIYSYKNARITKQRMEIQQKINELNKVDTPESHEEIILLLTQQKKLDKVKLLISDKLGRIII
ncbi:MAG: DNA primase [Flavobacteriales bacterium]|nr:DNA primase [Flavobacteriales bacterium]